MISAVKALILSLLMIIMLTEVGRAGAQPATAVPRFERTLCPEALADAPGFECGYLIVPEDHRLLEGKTIRLMVAIARSTAAQPAPDPVIVLAGGPGSPAVGGSGEALFTRAIRARRDIIYIDQRGTGRSEPSLNCPEVAQISLDTSAEQFGESLVIERVRACRDRLRAAGVNLAAFTSGQSAADIHALRRALGYEKVNLYGGSYGTRLGLTVMRDHPDGVRSAILDSVYPPDVDLYLEMATITDGAFNALFARCKTDLMCNLAYPDLRSVYLELYDQLNAHPAQIAVPVGDTDAKYTFLLTGDALSAGMFHLLYNPFMVQFLPSLLYQVRAGEYDRVKAFVDQQIMMMQEMSYGMHFSVMCSEEAPFSTGEAVRAAAARYPTAMRNRAGLCSVLIHDICREWLAVTPNPVENLPVTSDIPTLLLAGQYDPITPPTWARHAHETLRNGYLYEFPGIGHGAIGHPCAQLIALAFLDAPDRAPDAGCMGGMRDVAFVVTAEATRPYASALAALFGVGIVALVAVGYGLRRPLALRGSMRLVPWLPLIIGAGALALLLFVRFNPADKLRLVEIVIPAAVSIQAALAFAPEEEPALEVLFGCPRRPMWLLLERLGLALAGGTITALISAPVVLAVVGGGDLLLALMRWIPPMLFLSGIAVFVTVRMRLALGVALVLLVWGMAIAAGDALLPGQPIMWPLNYIQPLIWPFHPYLKPDSLGESEYVLNRIVVAGAGAALIALAAWNLRDTERILTGKRARGS